MYLIRLGRGIELIEGVMSFKSGVAIGMVFFVVFDESLVICHWWITHYNGNQIGLIFPQD